VYLESDKYNFFFNNIIIFSVLLLSCLVYFFLKKNDKKINYFIIHFSTIFSLFLLNLLIEISLLNFSKDNLIAQFEKKGVIWDHRTRDEVINDLKIETGKENIYKSANPTGFIIGNIAEKIDFRTNIVPLSNISNSTIVHCNETGVWRNYKSDKFGFNNPDDIIKINPKYNLVLIGDSFIEGVCVNGGEDIGSKLRSLNYNLLNLGKAGGGVASAIARLREYKHAYNFKSEFIIFFFYSYNDVTDTFEDYNHPFFKKYLDDKNFSQDLRNRQDEIDDHWKRFFSISSQKDFLIKHPELKKHGQTYILPNRSFNYKLFLKKVFLLTNIRAFIYDSLVARISNRKSKEKKQQLDILKKAFLSLKAEVNEIDNNTKLLLVYLPSHNELTDKKQYLRKEINNLTNELNIDFINIYDFFVHMDINDLFYYGLSGHYSSKGYKILAEIIDKDLLKRTTNINTN